MSLSQHEYQALAWQMWRLGDLSYLLHEVQQEWRRLWLNNAARLFVIECSRRLGKSFYKATTAVETALNNPGGRVPVACPTQKMAKSIMEPHIRQICLEAAPELQPRHYRQDGMWVFPNEAQIVLAGCDSGGADRLRGTDAITFIVDEAGFVEDLEYLVQDVLLPQTITTNGRGMLGSSPALSPEHPFDKRYALDAQARGSYVRHTIYDAPHIRPELIEEFKEEAGGETSTTWIREYLARPVVDTTRAVVPEFSRLEEQLVLERERPSHFDAYTVSDFGFHDLTATLFGYLDFKGGFFYVEDELCHQNAGSSQVARDVNGKEAELWGNQRPLLRVADAPLQTLADLAVEHKLTFMAAQKDDKHGAVNNLRIAVNDLRLRFHPRCKQAISHFRGAIWNRSRTSFERSGEFGHFDFVDAGKYLVRHVNWSKNPHPRFGPGVNREDYMIPPQEHSHQLQKLIGR